MVEQEDLESNWTLIEDDAGVAAAAATLERGHGPVGVDAERASGFRYGNDAYLVQVFRRDAGTFLFDPTTITSFDPLAEVLRGEEWILHSASQDLACLEALGLVPDVLFDTEVGSRLLGFERVGLGAIVERLLDIHLKKAHSASDWSTRPLPDSWLEYAAFDVALLPDLRDAVARELEAQEKTEFAKQEFEAIRTRPVKPRQADPWRRLSGGNKLKTPRQWAIARELWIAREELAIERDLGPGRLIPDTSIVVAAAEQPRSAGHLASLSDFKGRASRTELERWWAAVLRGKTTDDLPEPRRREPGTLPHHRGWAQRHPEAAARLIAARESLTAESERRAIPVENLLTPELVRRLAWEPPNPTTTPAIATELELLGARDWQIAIAAPLLTEAFVDSVQD